MPECFVQYSQPLVNLMLPRVSFCSASVQERDQNRKGAEAVKTACSGRQLPGLGPWGCSWERVSESRSSLWLALGPLHPDYSLWNSTCPSPSPFVLYPIHSFIHSRKKIIKNLVFSKFWALRPQNEKTAYVLQKLSGPWGLTSIAPTCGGQIGEGTPSTKTWDDNSSSRLGFWEDSVRPRHAPSSM